MRILKRRRGDTAAMERAIRYAGGFSCKAEKSMGKKDAILLAGFGTIYKENMEKTIGAIENRIRDRFSSYNVYRAFTSKVVKHKMEANGIHIYNVTEALEAVVSDGSPGLIVQPVYMTNGTECRRMFGDVVKYKYKFESIRYGEPLLSSAEDYKELAEVTCRAYPAGCDEAVVFVGHGSGNNKSPEYMIFQDVLRNMGYKNIFAGAINGYPGIKEVKEHIKNCNIKKICLVPMMIVAGFHVYNDIAGEKGSWKQQFEQDGYEVTCHFKGLGEIKGVQEMFVRHVDDASCG